MGDVRIVAGPGSAQFFRDNFLKRLGEVFHNLDWAFQNGVPLEPLKAEFRVFESLYDSLRNIYSGMPLYVSAPYVALRQKLDKA